MKKFALVTILLAGLLHSASAQSPFNQADIDAARAAGAQAAGSYSGSFEVDQNGKLVLDEHGNPKPVARSVDSLRGDLRKFQTDTGLSGVEQVSSPAYSGRNGTAKVAVNQNFTFSCKSSAGDSFAAAALGFRVDSCEMSGTSVRAVRFSICDAPSKAGTCSLNSDFNIPVRAVAGQYSAFNGLQLGLGCNSVATCQMSVAGAYTVGGNDASIKAQTQVAASESNAVADIRKTITEGDYAGKFSEIGEPLINGATEPPADSPTAGREVCAAQPMCLKEASITTTFTKSCVRSFPLTMKTRELQYADYASCDIEAFEPDEQGKVTPATNSCGMAPGTAPREGMTMVGRTESVCVPREGPDCKSKTHTEYWVNTSQYGVLSTASTPSAIGGACDDRSGAETTTFECLNDNWFGRTAASCGVAFFDEASGNPTGDVLQLDYQTKAGCGFCLTPAVNTTCYATPGAEQPTEAYTVRDSVCPSNPAELAGCTLKTVTDVVTSSPGGLVTSQREVYECTSTKSQCVQWGAAGNDPLCMTTDIAMGLDKQPLPAQSSGVLANAMVSAAMVEAFGKGLEVGSSDSVPKVFGGENMRCQRPAGGIGKLLQKNCCRTDLERPKKGNIFQDGCGMEQAKLAAARRSSYATYIGEYCSKKIKFLGMKKCLEYTQSYCVFPGMLPRLVQEQGRSQLEQMVASSSSASVQRLAMSYSYYSASDTGAWSPQVAVNGVAFSAWQWPAYCKNPQKAAEIMANDLNAKECPGVVTTWIAACDIPGGCGALPDEPLEGSLHWQLKDVNPLENLTTAVSRYGAVTGACSPQSQTCAYTAAAWPVGVGGKAVVSKELVWTLFNREQLGSGPEKAAAYEINNIGDLMFRGYAVAGNTTSALPAAVRVDFSRDGGQTWRQLSIPTDLKGREMSLGTDADVKLTGFCDVASNTCNYTVVGTVSVFNHPWGPAQRPDCSGFTAGQVAVLDFGKMDLSEWLVTVLNKAGATSPATLAAQATSQFQQFNALFQGGQVKAASPKATNFARVVPNEGFGPFTVKLAVAGYWPEVTGDPSLDIDRVTSVRVDWGNCKPAEFLEPVLPTEGTGFRGVHDYLTPDSVNYPCLKPADSAANVIHKIKLTIQTTRSGTQHRELSVENAWSKFPGASGHNVNVHVERVAPKPGAQAPAAPSVPSRR